MGAALNATSIRLVPLSMILRIGTLVLITLPFPIGVSAQEAQAPAMSAAELIRMVLHDPARPSPAIRRGT